MKIFVCEYITGGGLYREAMTDSLAAEGAMMRDALLSDLAGIPAVEVIVTYDARLPAPALVPDAIPVHADGDLQLVWSDCMKRAEAVWLIAPETDDILSNLTKAASDWGKRVIGCPLDAVSLMTNKYQTYRALVAAGIPTIPSYRMGHWLEEAGDVSALEWVVKPDDGVGCEGIHHFSTISSLRKWLLQYGHDRLIIQPYVEGSAASLSMICRDGRAWLLACNQQKVLIEAGRIRYAGSRVNAMADDWDRFEELARRLAAAFPSMTGYVGADVICNEQGLHVVEINPRLTTSYVGLRRSINCNPARLILDLLYNDGFDGTGFRMPEHMSRQVVEVTP